MRGFLALGICAIWCGLFTQPVRAQLPVQYFTSPNRYSAAPPQGAALVPAPPPPVYTAPPVIAPPPPPPSVNPYASAPLGGYPTTPAAPISAFPSPLAGCGLNWTQACCSPGVCAAAGGGALAGENVGLDDGYIFFQGFAPIVGRPGQELLFADIRALSYNDSSDAYGANLAIGYRFYNGANDRIFGGYGGVDYRNLGTADFTQISAGLESLGRLWDFRGNAYIVVSDNEEFLGYAPVFDDKNIRIDSLYTSAMSGFDAEVGRNLTPATPNFDLRLFGGFYGFFDDGTDDAWGVRGRVEGRWRDWLILGGGVQNDQVFGTTAFVQLTLLFGAGCQSNYCCSPSVAERLDDPLQKNMHVVVRDRQDEGPLAELINKDGTNAGVPIVVAHVDSAAAAGGDGSITNPFNTLADAEADADGPHIIYAHADSVFSGESITLADNQRFLGESDAVTHLFESQFGTLTLPRATTGTARPIIENLAGTAVTLADNNEVSGFQFQDVTTAISGTGIDCFDINQNLIQDTTSFAIFLENAGDGLISENTILRSANDSIQIGTTGSATMNVEIADNVIRESGQDAIEFDSVADSSTIIANIHGNELADSTQEAIDIFAVDNGTAVFTIADNTITGSQGDAIFGSIEDSATLLATIRDNTISETEDQAIQFNSMQTAQATVIVSDNTITQMDPTNGLEALLFVAEDDSILTAQVDGNTLTNGSADGVAASSVDNAALSINLRDNTISGFENGTALTAEDTSTLTAVIQENEITMQRANGVSLRSITGGTLNAWVGENSAISLNTESGIFAESIGGSTMNLGIEDNPAIQDNGGPANVNLQAATAGVMNLRINNNVADMHASDGFRINEDTADITIETGLPPFQGPDTIATDTDLDAVLSGVGGNGNTGSATLDGGDAISGAVPGTFTDIPSP